MTIVDHLEQHLGLIEEAWSTDAADNKAPLNVVRLPGGPLAGCKVFATVGLNLHELKCPRSSTLIRQELVFLAANSFGDQNVPGLLQQVGREALESHTALLRGDVLGPRGRLFQDGEMEALYVSVPAYFPESFAAFTPQEGLTIVIAWLVPVTAGEAAFVTRFGWSAFEDNLASSQPDLCDPTRPGLFVNERLRSE